MSREGKHRSLFFGCVRDGSRRGHVPYIAEAGDGAEQQEGQDGDLARAAPRALLQALPTPRLLQRHAPLLPGTRRTVSYGYEYEKTVQAATPIAGIWVAFFSRCQRYRCGQVWGNPRTISWEPHLERTLAQGQEASWTVEYELGSAGQPSL